VYSSSDDPADMLTWKRKRGSRSHSEHRYRWFAVGGLTFLLNLAAVTPSHAQLKPTIQKIDKSQIRRSAGQRDSTNFPYWISHSDCTADDVMTFKVQIQNPNVNNFEVWAGNADCSQLAQRQGNLAQCWQVYGKQVTKSPATIPIRAQDIVAQNGPKDGSNGVPGEARDCNNRITLDIKLYFMYVNDGNEVSSNVVTFDDVGIDLEGPIPPTIEDLLPSDDALIAEWENTDTTMFAGYRLYCAEAVASVSSDASSASTNTTSSATTSVTVGSQDAAADAGSDAGAQSTADETTTTTNVVAGCGGSDLQEGAYPSDGLRVCGTVDSYSARSGIAGGLKNGSAYAVGVTAVDRLGNESTISNVECNVPREVYTFYEDYRSAGGEGGGGFCSVGPLGRKRLTFASLLLASLAIVVAYYRRNSQS
jgi:hypothetical protein